MGLHLNYELRLPPDRSAADVAQTLERLHGFAATLPVHRVTRICFFDDQGAAEQSDRLEWFFREWSSILVDPPADSDDAGMNFDVHSAAGFVVALGKGSEPAPVGFLRGRNDTGTRDEWYWHACVKTQYASVVSEEHLIAVHTALIAILDYAIEIGVDVVVRDETGYWPSRDVPTLLESVRKMNRIVAAFAGRVSDDISGHPVGSPIFAHPDFEHLEMER
jgi:hypothetical protein